MKLILKKKKKNYEIDNRMISVEGTTSNKCSQIILDGQTWNLSKIVTISSRRVSLFFFCFFFSFKKHNNILRARLTYNT